MQTQIFHDRVGWKPETVPTAEYNRKCEQYQRAVSAFTEDQQADLSIYFQEIFGINYPWYVVPIANAINDWPWKMVEHLMIAMLDELFDEKGNATSIRELGMRFASLCINIRHSKVFKECKEKGPDVFHLVYPSLDAEAIDKLIKRVQLPKWRLLVEPIKLK